MRNFILVAIMVVLVMIILVASLSIFYSNPSSLPITSKLVTTSILQGQSSNQTIANLEQQLLIATKANVALQANNTQLQQQLQNSYQEYASLQRSINSPVLPIWTFTQSTIHQQFYGSMLDTFANHV